ncbi:MAG: hypothetical protein PHF37_04750 [Phycisphaerae bacterium]|nr:hypothetical protein [Phycisphaerae bacterium]
MYTKYENEIYVSNTVNDSVESLEEARPTERTIGGELLLTMAIWIPLLFVAAIFALSGVLMISGLFIALGIILHTILRPAFLVYVFIGLIPLEWMISAIPGITTVSKLVGVLALVVSVPKLLKAVPRKWDSCAYWIVAFIAWAIMGVLWAPYPIPALSSCLTLTLIYGIPLIMCVHIRTKVAIKGAMLVLLISCLFSAIGIIKTRDTHATLAGKERAMVTAVVGGDEYSKTENLNIMGRYMALGVFISIYMILTSPGIVKRLAFIGGAMILLVAIILLKGRATYLFLPVAVLSSIIMLKGAGLGKRLIIMVSVMTIGGILAFAIIKLGFIGSGIQDRFESIFVEGVQAGGRIGIWRAHVKTFYETGFRGAGLSMTRWIVMKVAHSDLFTIMGDLGLVGLITFFGFHATLFIRIQRIKDILPKLFCLMAWTFLILANMTLTGFMSKIYVLFLGIILLTVRHEEMRPIELSMDPKGVLEQMSQWETEIC